MAVQYTPSLRKKCRCSQFSCICIEYGEILHISSPNARKCGPEKLRIWTFFMQCLCPDGFLGICVFIYLFQSIFFNGNMFCLSISQNSTVGHQQSNLLVWTLKILFSQHKNLLLVLLVQLVVTFVKLLVLNIFKHQF